MLWTNVIFITTISFGMIRGALALSSHDVHWFVYMTTLGYPHAFIAYALMPQSYGKE